MVKNATRFRFRNYLTQKYTRKFGPAKIDICLEYDKNYIMFNNIVLTVFNIAINNTF